MGRDCDIAGRQHPGVHWLAGFASSIDRHAGLGIDCVARDLVIHDERLSDYGRSNLRKLPEDPRVRLPDEGRQFGDRQSGPNPERDRVGDVTSRELVLHDRASSTRTTTLPRPA
jgi:hypothetical protein